MPPEATPAPRTDPAPTSTPEPAAEAEQPTGTAPRAEAGSSDLEPELPADLKAPPSAPLSAQDGEKAAEAAAGSVPATVPDAVLPATYPGESQGGFWRRLRIGRTRRMAREEARDGKMVEIEARLAALEAQIKSIDDGLGLRFERIEQRFLQFWEMEEQLSQLTEITDRLEEVRRAQKDVVKAAQTAGGSMRTLSLILGVAVLALAGAVGALVLGG